LAIARADDARGRREDWHILAPSVSALWAAWDASGPAAWKSGCGKTGEGGEEMTTEPVLSGWLLRKRVSAINNIWMREVGAAINAACVHDATFSGIGPYFDDTHGYAVDFIGEGYQLGSEL
jgi:hypothetical protein